MRIRRLLLIGFLIWWAWKLYAALRRRLTIAPPESGLDKTIRVGAMVFVNPFSRKDAQGIHWRPYTGPVELTVLVTADTGVGDRSRGWLANFLHSDFTARRVVIFRPMEPGVTWHLCFTAHEGGEQVTQFCAAYLYGDAAATRQGVDTRFFGIEARTGRPIRLNLVEQTTKRKLGRNIPLL